MMRRLVRILLAASILGWPGRCAFGEEAEQPENAAPAPLSPFAKAFQAVRLEAGRYVADTAGLLTAPSNWNSDDWKKAAGVTAILAGLFLADEKIDHEAQNHRSPFTDDVSSATTSLGGSRGPQISVALVVGGILFHSPNTRDMGREAIEAGLFSSLLDQLVLKRAFGRERPFQSNGETNFHVGSSHDSFPSGHATEAFSVASVIAMRAPGWVIPALAYTGATLVAFDRVNDRVHFSSDVFAGAVLGTVTGRWLVARHRREEKKGAPTAASFDIVPIRNGLSAQIRF
jgi:membrane-associated phospholipid phosphatase